MEQSRTQQLRKAAADRSRPAGRSRGLIATNPPLRPLKRLGPGHWASVNGLWEFRRDGRTWVTVHAPLRVPMAWTEPTLRAAVARLA